MSLSLYLMRHAEAAWGSDGESDHDRGLEPNGRTAARTVGAHLSSIDEAPALVVSSSAVRARKTAQLAADAGGWACSLEVDESLYVASWQVVRDRIRGVDAGAPRLLVVGHEPTMSTLVRALTGGDRPMFPTAALARIDFDEESWRTVDEGAGRLVWLVTPGLLDSKG